MVKANMSTERYNKKRRFENTPEPSGDKVAPIADEAVFTVQKHSATVLHYDLRLEMDGVLKSWAVPKGPSLDPKIKRLAIHVEDHPLGYVNFEGVIPKGNYGAGKMIVWDIGKWTPIGDPHQGYEKGDLKFELHGEKLNGQWALVRTKSNEAEKKEHWLLIKKSDEHAVSESKYDIVNHSPLSVLTGRDINELEQMTLEKPKASVASPKKIAELSVKDLQGAKLAKIPTEIKVQLAASAGRIPQAETWLHEIKLDGYRMTIFKSDGKVTIRTRNALDWTKRFPTVAKAVAGLKAKQAILDGEIVMLRPDGVSDFGQLQQAIKNGNEHKLVFFAFDLLYADGFDLRACKLIDRKRALQQLLLDKPSTVLQYCEHVMGKGSEFFAQCRRLGLEGIMSKLGRSLYQSGRTDTWLKSKCILSDEFVIGGYTPSKKTRGMLAALLLGYYEDDKFVYAGKVGTGFGDSMLDQLKKICEQDKIKTSPFVSIPDEVDIAGAVWTKPINVARINYVGWSSSHQLRNASFIGLREDMDASQVKEPASEAAKAETNKPERTRKIQMSEDVLSQLADVKLSNPTKIYYPAPKITKLDIAAYYLSVAERILPYIQDRPVSLNRYPDGIERAGFVQKHPGPHGAPQWIDTVEDAESNEPFLEISSVRGLAAAVQLGTLEIHPWGSTSDRLDKPDRIIFDFDPEESIEFSTVRTTAMLCRDTLTKLGITSFVKTTGGRGAHVVLPIERRNSWDEALDFARLVATTIEKQNTKLYTTNMSKQARASKILIDIHRNHRGATCVAAYSVRARVGATVSMPLTWKEFEKLDNPASFDITSVPERVHKTSDPWKDFYTHKQRLTKSMFDLLRNGRLT